MALIFLWLAPVIGRVANPFEEAYALSLMGDTVKITLVGGPTALLELSGATADRSDL